MIGIGRLIYRATGIMSKKGIVKNCEAIGKALAQEVKATGGKVEPQRVHELLADVIGRKKASKIAITQDLDTFKAFAKENMNLTEEIAELHYKKSRSAVIPPGKSGKTLLSLRINDMSTVEALNASAHELEHVLYNSVSTTAKKHQFLLKLIPKAKLEKIQKQGNNLLNKTMLNFQRTLIGKANIGPSSRALYECTEHKAGLHGLLKQTGFETRKELHDAIRTTIREDVLLPCCDGKNLSLLKILRRCILDEARAYKVGGIVQRNFAPNENISKCEMIAQVYEEAAIVLKSEIKNQKMNKWRRFFGRPQKDYHIATSPVLKTIGEPKRLLDLKADNLNDEKVKKLLEIVKQSTDKT